MQNTSKLFGIPFIIAGTIALLNSAGAAPARVGAINTARMSTIPISNIPITETIDVPTQPATPVTPDPKPDPQPDPDPKPECPDGGVKDSAYTVDMCMDDVLSCVNGGALPNGINDMFDPDVRNAVMNGMNLCATQVDKCIREVRRNCKNVYLVPPDVWVDFNSRKIQPIYYNFVLQKTGMTPNQAENTCRLLDRNTYGESFNAVANSGSTTTEYNHTVGAYNNQQGNALIKNNPMGVTVNNGDTGVDGQRGHYARWDAKNAECLIRVAAYNKDKQITNSWLFGGIGNDDVAQVWMPAGETFTCNKDLFGFSLMNDTKTVAVVGVGGGTLLGAGIGAGIGAAANNNKTENVGQNCTDSTFIAQMSTTIQADTDKDNISKLIGLDDINNITYTHCTKLYDVCYQNISVRDIIKVKCDSNNQEELEVCYSEDSFMKKICIENNTALSPAKCEEKIDSIMQSTVTKLRNNSNVCNLFSKKPLSIGAATGIGAAAGAGAGGVATAITAFVEKNNISCHIGDDLDKVALGKSYSIDKLRDFYVKWNLNLPDTIIPTVAVTDCNSWKTACTRYTDLNQCVAAEFNYKNPQAKNMTLIYSPCTASGSACIANDVVLKSYGICE
ncbi:MAG: hypothetical protein MJ170_01195 [Alphaproteobacteria bacterium]|nr:hypothetical protein [Alphaproteobacteria bacterium]